MNFNTIQYAYHYDDAKQLDDFIRNHGYDVNFNKRHGDELFDYPIFRACASSAIKCLRVLIKHGAEINREVKFSHWTSASLFYVIIENFVHRNDQSKLLIEVEIIKTLVDHGANVNCSCFFKDLSFSQHLVRYLSLINYRLVQIFFLHGLRFHEDMRMMAHLALDKNCQKLYREWSWIIILYCLKLKKKCIIF